jgi:Ser/Thr protein kinase RdoA (MazF antagonist)
MDHGLALAIADRFDLGRVVSSAEFVARGAMGEIWRISTDQGRWATKLLFDWVEARAAPFDLEVQRTAAAAGVPLPRPVTDEKGAAVASLGTERVRVYEWVEIRPHRYPIDSATAVEVGRLLGLVHSMPLGTDGEVDPWYTSVNTANLVAGWPKLRTCHARGRYESRWVWMVA